MNRRSFLAIAGLLAGAALDPDRLLWVPGRKKIFIPPTVRPPGFIKVGDIITFGRDAMQYQVTKTWPPGGYVIANLEPICKTIKVDMVVTNEPPPPMKIVDYYIAEPI